MGTKPKDVSENETLQYDHARSADVRIAENFGQHNAKVAKHREESGFRELLPRNTWQRATKPR